MIDVRTPGQLFVAVLGWITAALIYTGLFIVGAAILALVIGALATANWVLALVMLGVLAMFISAVLEDL